MKPCTNCDEKGFELAHSYRVCPVCRGTHSVPTDTSKAINIKENDDGTLSPIDPSKPSSFGPTPDQPQADEPETYSHVCFDEWGARIMHFDDSCTNPRPAKPQPQADEDSARRRQEFADAGIYPDTDELDQQIDSLTFDHRFKSRNELRDGIKDLITREREQAKREVLEALYELAQAMGDNEYSRAFAGEISQRLAALTPNEPKEAE